MIPIALLILNSRRTEISVGVTITKAKSQGKPPMYAMICVPRTNIGEEISQEATGTGLPY